MLKTLVLVAIFDGFNTFKGRVQNATWTRQNQPLFYADAHRINQTAIHRSFARSCGLYSFKVPQEPRITTAKALDMSATSVVGEVWFGTYVAANFGSSEAYGWAGFPALKGQMVDILMKDWNYLTVGNYPKSCQQKGSSWYCSWRKRAESARQRQLWSTSLHNSATFDEQFLPRRSSTCSPLWCWQA
jgi:hypothetical protein